MAALTPEACRAGRALLKWGVRELAAAAGLSLATVVGYEAGRAHLSTTADAILAAFTAHGIEIMNSDAPGARLRRRKGD
jgi:hypothetical protein